MLAVGLLLGSTQSTLVPGKHQFWFFDSTNYNNAGTLLVLSTMLMTHYWLSVHVDCKVGRQKVMGCLALILPHGLLAMLSSYSRYARDKKNVWAILWPTNFGISITYFVKVFLVPCTNIVQKKFKILINLANRWLKSRFF